MTADAGEDAQHQPTRPRRRLRRRRRFALVLLAVSAVVVAIAWMQRVTIAEGFVDRELTRGGVPATYRIADVGLAHQRLTNVVIGDPARPDLVADWIDVSTRVGIGGPEVTGIAVGRVRMRARLVDGAVSLGALDRLMPPPSGKPFALPQLRVDAEDVRMRLEAPQGVIGLRLSGSGRLDDGFKGRLAAVSDRLDAGGCTIRGLAAATAVRVSGERPTIEGPARAARLSCGGAQASGIATDIAVTLGAALDRWTGRVRLSIVDLASAGVTARQLIGRISFDGDAVATAGTLDLKASRVLHATASAEAASLAGRYRAGRDGAQFNGRVGGEHARLAPALLARLRDWRGLGAGTPVGPIAMRLATAADAAARDLSGSAAVEAVMRGGGSAVRVTRADLASASGATLRVSGAPLRFGAVELGGNIALAGGGMPEGTIDLRREGTALAGVATLRPYDAGNARLALTPVTFRTDPAGATVATTTASLSGPLGDGRVEALRLPLAARWAGTRLVVNPACAPLAWQRLSVAGLTLDPARLQLCPVDGGMVVSDGGRLGGGVRIAAPRLTGRLGTSPLALAATGSELRLRDTGFALSGVAARLGAPDRVTRLDAAQLSGRVVGGAIAGRFAGAGGQIGNVPLVLSDAAGDWRMAGGVLSVGGRTQVADAAAEARFKPLYSDDVALKLADGRITTTGTLRAPKGNTKVADIAIEHRLSSGGGRAVLDVPGITFASDGFQPDDLTPLTFGVIADVKGSIAGRGEIAWTAGGVTSSGRFGTDDTDLAAAFGPVSNIKGELVFTDLLGLVSAPDQVATIGVVNPGIAVENGTVRYRLVGDNRVQVTGGQWPFAGGELVLEPTLLDFNEQQQRRMTFRVAGVQAAQFLQQFDFDNLNATGIFDGVLPMIFDDAGGRIADGRLAARTGGSLAYIGAVSEKNLGTWGNLAFQALKALDYRNLNITLNGPLAGEMVSEIRFAGVSQGKGTKSNFVIRRLAKLPLVFNVTVRAPFRQLFDSVRSFYDPSRLIQRNLPALIEEQRRREQQQPALPPRTPSPANRPGTLTPPIQPSESEKRP